MKKYLFITHLTPQRFRSTLREKLMDIMRLSLQGQSYPAWKALWIGEKESEQGNIKEVKVKDDTREELMQSLRAVYDRADVQAFVNDCDYVIKLDDDDVISATALENASTLEFDCYFDEYHTFYDITSGVVTLQKRNWIPSTAIHKKEHAFRMRNENNIAANLMDSLFYSDHAKDWIAHYRQHKLVHTERYQPLYLRVLSPTSITAGATSRRILSAGDIDLEKYNAYRRQFGAWRKVQVRGFENYLPQLEKAWPEFSGTALSPIADIPLKVKIKSLLGMI